MSTAPRLRPQSFRALSELLFDWTGIQLHGKEQMVEGRLGPKLRERGIGFTQYIATIKEAGPDSPDATGFINALTTNKTSFFRESHHFDFLRDHVIQPAIREAERGGRYVLRFWSAAASTGEEPYSLALLCHHFAPASRGWDVKILATDIDTQVLDTARAATYDRDVLETIPEKLAAGAFVDVGQKQRQLRPEIARLVHYARANLIEDPFPVRGSFHAVLCRNVMIYFDRATQQRVVGNLVQRVRPGGYLIVGHSESLVAPHLERAGCVGVYSIANGSPAREAAPTVAAIKPKPVAKPVVKPKPSPPPPAIGAGPARTITVGEIAVSSTPLHISTLLGSCVSACLHDPVAKIGGMNHFLLPQAASNEHMPARFGVQAMELLINKLMAAGAQRDRLIAKVFGAARVAKQDLLPVAEANAAFIRSFLHDESIPIVVERLGGNQARQIRFDTDSGAVEVRCITPSQNVIARELDVARVTPQAPAAFDVEAALF